MKRNRLSRHATHDLLDVLPGAKVAVALLDLSRTIAWHRFLLLDRTKAI